MAAMSRVLVAAIALCFLTLACSSGDADEGAVLHLDGFDVPESSYRAEWKDLCNQARQAPQGRTPAQVAQLFSLGPPYRDGTPIAGQKATTEALARRERIFKDECGDLLPP